MLVTDWPGKISGISYKSGRCDDCDMFQLCRSVLFCDLWPGASGDLGNLDGIQYMGDNDLCIDHLQHTEAEVIVEQMGSFEEDGTLLITVLMQMQPFRSYLLERTLDNRVICSGSAGMHISMMEVMVVCH